MPMVFLRGLNVETETKHGHLEVSQFDSVKASQNAARDFVVKEIGRIPQVPASPPFAFDDQKHASVIVRFDLDILAASIGGV